ATRTPRTDRVTVGYWCLADHRARAVLTVTSGPLERGRTQGRACGADRLGGVLHLAWRTWPVLTVPQPAGFTQQPGGRLRVASSQFASGESLKARGHHPVLPMAVPEPDELLVLLRGLLPLVGRLVAARKASEGEPGGQPHAHPVER